MRPRSGCRGGRVASRLQGTLPADDALPLVPSPAGGLWVLPSLAFAYPSSLVAFPHNFINSFAWQIIPGFSDSSCLPFPTLPWVHLLPWRYPAVISCLQGIWAAVSGGVVGRINSTAP